MPMTYAERIKIDQEARDYADRSENENLLLSASAGCGKTYTLVNRIVNRALKEDGTPVDRLLVLTFTRAAAAELKNKINDELTKRIDDYLKKGDTAMAEKANEQRMLLGRSTIGTLDFFTGDIVKKHFTKIGIEPRFDISPAEVKLITGEVIDDVLEEYYGAEKDSEKYKIVREMVDVTCDTISSDDDFKIGIIKKLVDYCDYITNPEEWLDSIVNNYDDEKLWYDFFKKEIDTILDDSLEQIEVGRKILGDPTLCFKDIKKFEDCLDGDEEIIKKLKAQIEVDYGIFDIDVEKIEWSDFPSNSPSDSQEEKAAHDYLKSHLSYRFDKMQIKIGDKKTSVIIGKPIEDSVEELIKGFTKANFFKSIESMKNYTKVLAEIAKKIYVETLNRCKEKSVYSFSQIAHFAMDILNDEDIAKLYQEQFIEIYIDEYQDTNQLQEDMLLRVSRLSQGIQNMFMVGDVKQSIYEFRQATPEFFISKYSKFKDNPAEGKLKILSKNFRSRNEILQGTNAVFNEIMTEKTAGMNYTDGHELLYGADRKYGPLENEPSKANKCEFLYASERHERFEPEDVKEKENKKETIAIAKRIVELFESGFKVAGNHIRFGDICILCRTKDQLSDVSQYLSSLGIPVSYGANESLFDKYEVLDALAYLKLINNPHDDISLCTCLRSKFGEFSDNELALLRLLGGEKCDLFDCIKNVEAKKFSYTKDTDKFNTMVSKVHEFYMTLLSFREKLKVENLSELTWEVVNINNYYDRSFDGAKANLRLLVDVSAGFNSGVKGGLLPFINHVDRIIEKEKDSPTHEYPAASNADSGDAIKFMTVHASKGLEFPVVILAKTNSPYKSNNNSPKVFIDSKYGFGLDFLDDSSEEAKRNASAPMRAIKKNLDNSSREESQRNLYVALTRATEKLIVTAGTAKLENAVDLYGRGMMPTTRSIKGASTYAKMISFGLFTEEGQKYWDVYQGDDDETEILNGSFAERVKHAIEISKSPINASKKTDDNNRVQEVLKESSDTLNTQDDTLTSITEAFDEFAEKVHDATAEDEGRIPAKLSVSSLKKLADEESEEDLENYDVKVELKPFKTINDGDAKETSGTGFGTLMHKAMELLIKESKDFPENENEFSSFVSSLVQKWENQGYFKKNEINIIDTDMLIGFLGSEIAKEVKTAGENVRTETPFTVLVDIGKYVKSISNKKEIKVAIQGVIDLYYKIGDVIKIVDFKTDHKGKDGTYRYIDSYKMQLDCYRDALEKITGEKVSSCMLYFLRNGEIIVLK